MKYESVVEIYSCLNVTSMCGTSVKTKVKCREIILSSVIIFYIIFSALFLYN